jgi:hypothetical protein
MMAFPVAPPGATMAISFQSDEEVLQELRKRLREMSDQELVRFRKEVRRLAENPFQRSWITLGGSGSGGNKPPNDRILTWQSPPFGILPEPTEGTQQRAGNLTAALPRRPVTCDEGRSHDRNSFFAACFHLTDAVRLQWR